MILKYFNSVKEKVGKSLLSSAHGRIETRATILSYPLLALPSEKIAGGFQQAGKNSFPPDPLFFLPACQSAEGGQWGGIVSALPMLKGGQNRKIFVSLIEKNWEGKQLKKCKEIFSVLLAAVAKRRRAETLGKIQSAKSRGFCSKKVRISSNKHHHIELVASLGALSLASAGRFASKLKGFLKSISSRPAARRQFTNEICFARRAMSRFFSFAFGERQSKILLNCRCGVSFFNYN